MAKKENATKDAAKKVKETKPKETKLVTVTRGNMVKVEYTGTFDDGTVFDSSAKHGEPLEFQAGAGQVVPGFDSAVVGMKLDEEKKVTIKPADAYGEANPQLIKTIPKGQLPEKEKLTKGMVLALNLPNGMQLPASITEVGADTVTIDFNHPLAGKTLHFTIKIAGISAAKAHQHDHSDCGSCSSHSCGH